MLLFSGPLPRRYYFTRAQSPAPSVTRSSHRAELFHPPCPADTSAFFLDSLYSQFPGLSCLRQRRRLPVTTDGDVWCPYKREMRGDDGCCCCFCCSSEVWFGLVWFVLAWLGDHHSDGQCLDRLQLIDSPCRDVVSIADILCHFRLFDRQRSLCSAKRLVSVFAVLVEASLVDIITQLFQEFETTCTRNDVDAIDNLLSQIEAHRFLDYFAGTCVAQVVTSLT